MRRFVLVLLVAVLCSLISRDATAATYYVSPSGDDSGGGSITVPWRTVAKAARGVSPGDTVYFRDGSWNERLVPGASGAEGAMITFAAYPGEDAVFDGTGVAVGSDSGLIDLTGRSFIRISGLCVS